MMRETKNCEDAAFPGVDSIEGDWFNFGICLDGTSLSKGYRELFRATLKMRQGLVTNSLDKEENSDY